jgi:hypothetical protein
VAIIMQGMVIYMNEQQLQTLEQLQAFLDGTPAIEWQAGRGSEPPEEALSGLPMQL